MKIVSSTDGSATVTMHGDVIRVGPDRVGPSLQCLLDEIAKLEKRVGALEAEAKKKEVNRVNQPTHSEIAYDLRT